MNENLTETVKKTLDKLDEICHRLESIESNTYVLDDRQLDLERSLKSIRSAVSNDNLIG